MDAAAHTAVDLTSRRSRLTTTLWIVPFAYGLLLLAASAWWLVTGTPFDSGTYERIGRSRGDVVVGTFTPAQSATLAVMVRLLGGNGGVLAGALTVAVARFGFRSRAKWAWLTMWALPLHALIDLTIVSISGGFSVVAAAWDLGLAALMIATLVVSHPDFLRTECPEALG